MNRINLCPADILSRVQVRRRARAWGSWLSIYGAFLLCACGVYATGGDTFPSGQPDVEQVRARAESLSAELADLRKAIAATRAEQQSVLAAQNHPDWSRLLNLVAVQRGEDVVLTGLEMRPSARKSTARSAAPAGKPDAVPGQYTIGVTGIGRSQRSVSDFVARLEGLGLFQSVSINQTGRALVEGAEMVDFSVTCELDGAPAEPNQGGTR